MQLVRLISAVVLTIYIVTMFGILARDGLAALQFMFRGYWSSLITYLFPEGSKPALAYAGKVLFNQVTAAASQHQWRQYHQCLTDQIVSTKAKTSLGGKSRFVMRCPTHWCYCLNRYLRSPDVDNSGPEPGSTGGSPAALLLPGGEFANDLRAQAAQQQCFGILELTTPAASRSRWVLR